MIPSTSNAGPAPDVLLWVQLDDGHRYENVGAGRPLRRLSDADLPWTREDDGNRG
jgi:hypothetical protein